MNYYEKKYLLQKNGPVRNFQSQLLLILLSFSLIVHSNIYGQTGTSGDPFTAFDQVCNLSTSGVYYFNIGGTAFSTYVETGNPVWILAASGDDATTETIYATTTALTLQSDAILPSSIYTSTDITRVRINATSGPNLPLDAVSTHSATLSNLQNDRILSLGVPCCAGNEWTGTLGSPNRMTCSGAGDSYTLNKGIYHAAHNGPGLFWFVIADASERVNWSEPLTRNDLNLWISACALVLPVEIIEFTSRLAFGEINLSWRTASELNNAGFYLQRSPDAKNWHDLAFLPGHGTTHEEQSYTYTDERPLPGMNYYRLQQVDYDGQFEYSKIVSVEMGRDGSGISLYPNPAANSVTLALQTDYTGEASLTLYDLMGRQVKTQTLSLEGGVFRSEIGLDGLPAGVYLAEVVAGREQWRERLVVE